MRYRRSTPAPYYAAPVRFADRSVLNLGALLHVYFNFVTLNHNNIFESP